MQRASPVKGVEAGPMHASTLRRTRADWQWAGDDRHVAADKW
jgi:hypothetical protein